MAKMKVGCFGLWGAFFKLKRYTLTKSLVLTMIAFGNTSYSRQAVARTPAYSESCLCRNPEPIEAGIKNYRDFSKKAGKALQCCSSCVIFEIWKEYQK